MNSFVEQIKKLNEKYGKILTIEELDELRNNGELDISKVTTLRQLDRLAFVHVTDYMPTENKIKTAKEKGVISNFKGYNIKNPRDTTHFTINGTVTTHDPDRGNWDRRKYAVIILGGDFSNNNEKNIVTVRPEDTWIDGSADITNAFILCTKNEYAIIQEKNPKTLVIPCDAENVLDIEIDINYPEKFMEIIGLTTHSIGAHGYKATEQSVKFFEELENIDGLKGESYTGCIHAESLQHSEEAFQIYVQYAMKVLESEQKLEDRFLSRFRDLINYCQDNEIQPDRVKKSVGMANQYLFQLGISNLSVDLESQRFVEYSVERIKQSQQIDKYLGVNISDIDNTDLLKANIKRIHLITQKMLEQGNLHDKEGKDVLSFAIGHLLTDYVNLAKLRDERADIKDLNLEEYAKLLKKSFKNMGIRIDEIDNIEEIDIEKFICKIKDRVIEEKETQVFLEEQGYTEQGQDLALRDIARIIWTEEIMKRQIIEAIQSGKYDQKNRMPLNDDVFNKALEINDKAIDDLIIDNAKTEEREAVNTRLSEMGITNTDLSQKDNKRKLKAIMDKRYDKILTEAEQEAAEQKVVASEVEPNTKAPDIISELEYSYSKGRVGTSDVNGAEVDIRSKVKPQKSRNTLEGQSKQ